MPKNIVYSDKAIKPNYRHNRLTAAPARCYSAHMKLRIRELRLAKGLTQHQIAAKAGISQSYFNEIETGRKTVNARRLEQIADALGVQVADLVIGEESDPRSRLLRAFDSLPAEQRQLIILNAEALAGIRHDEK